VPANYKWGLVKNYGELQLSVVFGKHPGIYFTPESGFLYFSINYKY